MTEEELLQKIDAQSMEQRERVRMILPEKGRHDVLADFDRRMKEIDNGIHGAKSTWAALTIPQRRTLEKLVAGSGTMHMQNGGALKYIGPTAIPGAVSEYCRLPTARNLIARGLLACEGGAFRPEHVLTITERGRFVVKHGPSPGQ